MKPGIYKAKVVDYAMTETRAGDAQVSIKFQFDENQQMMWWGSLKEGKASEITIEALRECGFVGESLEDLLKIGQGPKSGALSLEKEIEITIADQMSGDATYKPKIVRVGAAGFKNTVTGETLKAKLGGHLAGVLTNIKPKQTDDTEIPF